MKRERKVRGARKHHSPQQSEKPFQWHMRLPATIFFFLSLLSFSSDNSLSSHVICRRYGSNDSG